MNAVSLLTMSRASIRITVSLLTGHAHLQKHLNIIGLRKDIADEKTSVHVFCECASIMMRRHRYLSAASLRPEDIQEP